MRPRPSRRLTTFDTESADGLCVACSCRECPFRDYDADWEMFGDGSWWTSACDIEELASRGMLPVSECGGDLRGVMLAIQARAVRSLGPLLAGL